MSNEQKVYTLSRRQFLTIAGTSFAAAILAACAPAAPTAVPTQPPAAATTAPPPAAATATTAAPAATVAPAAPTAVPAAPTTAPATGAGKPGGTLKYAMNNEPDSLDPAMTAQASAFNVMLNLYDTLIWQDPSD